MTQKGSIHNKYPAKGNEVYQAVEIVYKRFDLISCRHGKTPDLYKYGFADIFPPPKDIRNSRKHFLAQCFIENRLGFT